MTMTRNERPEEPATPWRGFHHIALVTPDLDATIAFYRDVLGMTIGEIAVRGGGRHCFIHPGMAPPGDCTSSSSGMPKC